MGQGDPSGQHQGGMTRTRAGIFHKPRYANRSGLLPINTRVTMRRRNFVAAFGGAVAWPIAAHGQQAGRTRRVGVLMPFDENDPVAKAMAAAFTQALENLGWIDGGNLRMDLGWGGGDTNRIRTLAQELVGRQPDVIVPHSILATAAVQRETQTIPIVFVNGCALPIAGDLPRPKLRVGRRVAIIRGGYD